MESRIRRLCLATTIGVLSSSLVGSFAAAQERSGSVYVMTNEAAGNEIAAYTRSSAGLLTSLGSFPTGGLGFGSAVNSLASQGALAISPEGHFLYAVNAGSNTVSVMTRSPSALTLFSTVGSGGTEPVSLTLYKNLLYVLNAGGTPNISGFTVLPNGRLVSLAGSQQPLAGGTSANPAEIAFSPDGQFLAVTEKSTNLIDTYTVLGNGLTSGPISMRSNGMTPYGFAFALNDTFVDSEAVGGSAGAGVASSYAISAAGNLSVISGSVADTQTAPCWVVITNNGSLVFVANNDSKTISSYSLAANGVVTLLNATAGTTSNGPTDMALSNYGHFLYVLNSFGSGIVSAFSVEKNGNLSSLPGVSGLPLTAQGIVAQ